MATSIRGIDEFTGGWYAGDDTEEDQNLEETAAELADHFNPAGDGETVDADLPEPGSNLL